MAGAHVNRVVLRPKAYGIELARKAEAARHLLAGGRSVVVEVRLRGRELGRPELAARVLDRLVANVDPAPVITAPMRVRGGIGRAVLGPPLHQ
jgi:translation initiation factor IF-3